MLEGVQDHIVSSLHANVTPYDMWKSLTNMIYNSSDHKNLVLKDSLRKIKMEEGNMIQKYLQKFTKCRYELGGIGVTIADDYLVSLTLLGLTRS